MAPTETLLSQRGGRGDHCLDPLPRNPAWGTCLTDSLQHLGICPSTRGYLYPGEDGAGGVPRGQPARSAWTSSNTEPSLQDSIWLAETF